MTRTTSQIVLEAIRLPEPPSSRWHRAGIGSRAERIFDIASGFVIALFGIGWTWSIANARAAGDADAMTAASSTIAAALTESDAPSAAFLTSAAMEAMASWRGESGRLRVRFTDPGAALPVDTLPAGARLELHGADGGTMLDSLAALSAPSSPASRVEDPVLAAGVAAGAASTPTAPVSAGVWHLAIKAGSIIKPITDFSVITLRPFNEKQRGRIGLYYIGTWPYEKQQRRAAREQRYRLPRGFIEVTRENQYTYVSDHFRLRDFLTKDQPNVWPKYLVLDSKLLDKLELVLDELARQGHHTDSVRVLSGFRTPNYNTRGGDPRGRAELSRHMYGDAADIYLDRNGDGRMDDLNRDRRSNIRDARIIEQAVNAVERAHPALLGGTGVYPGTGAHGPFVHIDTRGWRARWVGTRDSQ